MALPQGERRQIRANVAQVKIHGLLAKTLVFCMYIQWGGVLGVEKELHFFAVVPNGTPVAEFKIRICLVQSFGRYSALSLFCYSFVPIFIHSPMLCNSSSEIL